MCENEKSTDYTSIFEPYSSYYKLIKIKFKMKIKFFKPMALLLFVIGSFSCDKEPKLSSEKEILSFQINGVEGQIAKTEWGSFVDVFLPLGTDLSALTPIITVSDKATVLPPSGGTQDFSDFIVSTMS